MPELLNFCFIIVVNGATLFPIYSIKFAESIKILLRLLTMLCSCIEVALLDRFNRNLAQKVKHQPCPDIYHLGIFSILLDFTG